MAKRKSSKKRWKILSFFLFAFIVFLAGLVFYAEKKLARLVPGGLGDHFPTFIFAAPFTIQEQSNLGIEEITARMKRVGYTSTTHPDLRPGEYNWLSPELKIHLRGYTTPFQAQEKGIVYLVKSNDGTWSIRGRDDVHLRDISFEPERVAELSGEEKIRREPATWEEIPDVIKDAIVAVEDKRFFKHSGIDPRAIGRAAVVNLSKRRRVQGGSTITQQLAKNFFLTHKPSFRRKFVEAFLAFYLDLRYSKEHILTHYLNQIYMGQDGFVSIAGIKSAVHYYFNKDLQQITLAEAALIAGLVRSPHRYNPYQHPDLAKTRRDIVLKVMREENIITDREFLAAKAAPLGVIAHSKAKKQTQSNDYFIAEVVRRMLTSLSEDTLYRFGLRIYTTLDPVMQELGQKIVQSSPYQSALIAIDPQTGRVKALIGGKNYRESQFNRATQARRQPGSAFKVFVYGAALEKKFTPATILSDEPRAFSDRDGKIWAPQNFDRKYHGPISLRNSLAMSLNAATLDLASKIGIQDIIYFAERMGISSPLSRDLSIALGTNEVTPLEITAAYAPFANNGFRVTPSLINAVVDMENTVVQLNAMERTPVINPALATLMTSLLQSTIEEGTAKSLNQLGWKGPSAGKTGTTNDGRDAWFIGYTANMLTGVWVGDDQAKALQLSGAKDAIPLWARFMNGVYKNQTPPPFPEQQGLVSARIDPTTGLLARSGCTLRREELFISGTEPTQDCTLHQGGIKGWFNRLFSKEKIPHGQKPSDLSDE